MPAFKRPSAEFIDAVLRALQPDPYASVQVLMTKVMDDPVMAGTFGVGPEQWVSLGWALC